MEASRKKVVELNIQDVLPNRFQPRIKFNEEAINELSKSIKEHGVIQPIVVRPIGDKFEIIAGERRYKASCMAGLNTIPAIITDLNDKDSAEVALIENVQRENLTPIEEAISYKKILDMGYITQDGLASKLGKTQSTVANKLRLLNLDDEVQEALLNEKISERHARSLLKLQNKEQQKQLLNKIINERLTVRRADEEIDKLLNGENINETQQNTQSEPKEFKFINIPSIEPQKQEESENIKEDMDDIEEAEIQPSKFFNILDEEKQEPKVEEQIVDFNKIFMNPVDDTSSMNNNALLEELNEIENSINNSSTIKPINNEATEEPKNEEKSEEKVSESAEKIEQPINDEDDDLDFIEEFEDEEEIKQSNSSTQQEEKDNKTIIIPETKIKSFKDVLQIIRECSDKIEEAGFIIDTEEYDLDDTYQVVFKINK